MEKVSRREFLIFAGLSLSGSVLNACGRIGTNFAPSSPISSDSLSPSTGKPTITATQESALIATTPPTSTLIPPSATPTYTPTSTRLPVTPSPTLPSYYRELLDVQSIPRKKFTFEQALVALRTPEDLEKFMKKPNFKYGRQEGDTDVYNPPASLTYTYGWGDCDDFAIFQAYVLEYWGWDAWMLGLSIESTIGHNVAIVRYSRMDLNHPNKILVLDVNGSRPPIDGSQFYWDRPANSKYDGYFDTIDQVLDCYIKHKNMLIGGSAKIIRASIIDKPIKDIDARKLPWEILYDHYYPAGTSTPHS